jgi:hypothetical protein
MATRKLVLGGGKVLFFYDPRKWTRHEVAQDPGTQQFSYRGGASATVLYGDDTAVPLAAVEGALIDAWKSAGVPDGRVVAQAKRLVNGREVLCAQIKGTWRRQGMTIPAVCLVYFHSGKEGTITVDTHVLGFDLVRRRYRDDVEEFLNGLEIVQ